MRGKFSSGFRELVLTAGLPFVLILVAFWFAAQYIAPAPPRTITVATATKGSPYYEVVQRYRSALAGNGVTLEVLETSGSMENLRHMRDPSSHVSAAFLQGGIANAKDTPDVRSIGRLFHEPVWIFYQGPEKLERVTALVGKRVLIGPTGSATSVLAQRLLAASGVTNETAILINMELPDYVEALDTDKPTSADNRIRRRLPLPWTESIASRRPSTGSRFRSASPTSSMTCADTSTSSATA